MNNEENTPLLPAQRHLPNELDFVPVLPTVRSLDTADLTQLRWEDLLPHPVPASLQLDESRRLAFVLVVLLQLRRQKIAQKDKSVDVYDQWIEEKARVNDIELIEMKASELWEHFLTQYHAPRELYDVLWSQFPLAHNKSLVIRVIDFLSYRDAPQLLTAHPVVSATMSRTWKLGRPQGGLPENWLFKRFSASTTPYKIHFLELLFDLAFTFLLLSYVIRPPNWPNSDERPRSTTEYSYSIKEVYILIYALSVLVSGRGATAVNSVLILFAFLLTLPSLPLPGSLPFSILLWVILFRLLMYHIPSISPGPLFLVPHECSLPLAIFLVKGLIRIVRPLFLFYFPVLVVASLALSISLSGPLTGPLIYILQIISNPSRPDPPIIGAAPMDTRIVLFILSLVVFFVTLSSAYVLGTSMPFVDFQLGDRSFLSSIPFAWNFYSVEMGHEARTSSYRVTVRYAMDNSFPPPLNLFELFFVTLPIGVVRFFGYHHANRATVAQVVWNITVKPFVIVTTLLCYPLVSPF